MPCMSSVGKNGTGDGMNVEHSLLSVGPEACLPSVAGTPICLGAGLMLYFSQPAGWCMVGTHLPCSNTQGKVRRSRRPRQFQADLRKKTVKLLSGVWNSKGIPLPFLSV